MNEREIQEDLKQQIEYGFLSDSTNAVFATGIENIE